VIRSASDIGRVSGQLCDYVTPNETEVADITGVPVNTVDEARKAGDALLKLGAKNALITLGANGPLLHNREQSVHVPTYKVKVVETTGAGDAFNGAFAVAIGEGRPPVEATRFACACAALSVTKAGRRLLQCQCAARLRRSCRREFKIINLSIVF